MKKKKIAAIVTSVALIAAVGIGATLAYFTDQDTKQNVITMGKVDGSLEEESTDGTPTDDGYTYDKVKPGDKLDKNPSVSLAADSEDAYTRMMVTITIDGLAAGTNADAYEALLETKLNIQNGWTKGSDGYYYYNTKLSNKEGGQKKTENIFTTVTIPTEWGNEISEATITIDLQAELIQADNFEDGEGNILRDADGKIIGWANTGDIKEYK